jgi:hypothetical protein
MVPADGDDAHIPRGGGRTIRRGGWGRSLRVTHDTITGLHQRADQFEASPPCHLPPATSSESKLGSLPYIKVCTDCRGKYREDKLWDQLARHQHAKPHACKGNGNTKGKLQNNPVFWALVAI